MNPESPLSSSSSSDTTLPTPTHPSSRRASLLSPAASNGMSSPSFSDDGDDKRKGKIPPPRPHSSTRRIRTPSPPGKGAKSLIPSISVESLSSPTPTRRMSVGRAPPPPPIFLRQPTGLGSEEVPVPVSAGSSSDSREEMDRVHDLAPSPSRRTFSYGNEGLASPAWQSMNVSPASASTSWGRGKSMDMRPGSAGAMLPPPSPLVPPSPYIASPNMASPIPKRFEPTPNHGIHSRNLSLFFPQPGNAPASNGLGVGLAEGPASETLIGGSGRRASKGFDAGGFSFGSKAPSNSLETPDGKRGKRRGHHHKHSLSHNFFSFLDPTETNPSLASPNSHPSTPQPVPMPLLSASHAASSTLSPLPPSKSDPKYQLLLSFAVLECLIGAAIWVEGQMSGWRCLAGLGYLVVFDAMG
ncbi:hypothetical protein P7C73_g4884, partial [Tremellales sp. Uapishka_1]